MARRPQAADGVHRSARHARHDRRPTTRPIWWSIPSLQEIFPNAVGEAMACGRPVVAADAGGTGRAGGPRRRAPACWCRPPTPTRWPDAVSALFDDPARLAGTRRGGAPADRGGVSDRAGWSTGYERALGEVIAAVDDVRWFASNAYTALVVPALRRLGPRDRHRRRAARARRARDVRAGGRGRVAVRRAARARATGGLPLGPAAAGHRARAAPIRSGGWRDGSPAAAPVGRVPPAPRLLQPPAVHRRAGRRRVGAEHAHTRDGRRAIRRRGRSGCRTATTPTASCPGRRRAEPAEPPTLLTVSRLRPHKNQAAVLARGGVALGRRCRCGSSAGARSGARSEALRRAARRPLPDRDRGGRCGRRPRAYHEAAVAVCPSRFEGFGLTPIEAVASGVPVVASDIPPHREFVGGRRSPGAARRRCRLSPRPSTTRWTSAPADPALVRELTIPAAAARFLAVLRPFLG